MILFTEQEIKNKVGEIAFKLKKNHHDLPPVFICVLNGAFMFFTDLVKHMGDCEIDFINAKSYQGTKQGEITIIDSIKADIEGKDVYLVDDIYDSGNTMNYLVEYMKIKEPKSITLVTLCKRKDIEFPNHIYGFELNDEWIVGMGCNDENGFNRNRTSIYSI
jgi:hypoxanthine phosphoribosyltransferase